MVGKSMSSMHFCAFQGCWLVESWYFFGCAHSVAVIRLVNCCDDRMEHRLAYLGVVAYQL
jgi:hypothetical protein